MANKTITVGRHKFKYMPGVRWVANLGRLVVRRSRIATGMWVGLYQVGGDDFTNLKRDDGLTRRFRTKENAMAALVKAWDAI